MGFDINKFTSIANRTDRYPQRLSVLRAGGKDTSCIEQAVSGAVDNINQHQTRSFVIYGEPQSGKTEMMIALTARLLDDGLKVVVHLLNDSLQLLEQNLDRFRRSGLAPSPCNFTDILDPSIKIGTEEWVIFCKKNSRDLAKLIEKIDNVKNKVIIDDEADYATPNAKVNKGEKTRINALIEKVLGKDGIYIGVTATPARLDLNNTFENDHEKWVDFPTHSKYTGQDTFFPISHGYGFKINLLPDAGDDPKYCRAALINFMVTVAHLNTHLHLNGGIKNYSFLVHTSGKKADHNADYQAIQKTFGILSNTGHKDYANLVEQIWQAAEKRWPGNADYLTTYILQNAGCKNIVVMNSDKDTKNYKSATEPSAIFTVVIGGNIVSRGVTFDNLLAMYFTRDVQHKLQQDTYIQRARMFGSRGDYLSYFELTIPETLYFDWHRCFIFHRLSLDAIRSGRGAPVWLQDTRIAAVANSSIDKSNVSLDSGEMSYKIFDYTAVENQVANILGSNTDTNFAKLQKLHLLLGEMNFPSFVLSYIKEFSPQGDGSIFIHEPHSIANYKDDKADKENISRKKGFMGGASFKKNKDIPHHFQILYNEHGKARLFYKYSGQISFLKNMKHSDKREAA